MSASPTKDKTKISAKGKGDGVVPDTVKWLGNNIIEPLQIEFRASNGNCWAQAFDGEQVRRRPGRIKARD